MNRGSGTTRRAGYTRRQRVAHRRRPPRSLIDGTVRSRSFSTPFGGVRCCRRLGGRGEGAADAVEAVAEIVDHPTWPRRTGVRSLSLEPRGA
jgi:hypothetical protein